MTQGFVRVGNQEIGPDRPVFTIAEIGINHNGSLETAMKLVDAAVEAGCDAVKFQKRTIEIVYTPEELAKPRASVFGASNGDLKRGLEFGREQYRQIDSYCKAKKISWFASCWDERSVDFIAEFDPPCFKIASASLTDDALLKYHRRLRKPIILSTGMSDLALIEHAVSVLGSNDLVLMHCTSTYPSDPAELNLRGINTLAARFGVPVGYSGHEVGLQTTVAAVALGARAIERHLTLDRSMWGSDQSASVEPQGFARLVRDVRVIEKALGDGAIRIYESERPIIQKLRRVQ
ncbi:MAG: N-acetylneuraminate synthase [Gemmatimonadetes bacterium]|nr:N-acetylneuraminate synthase [Gemmatimonadota bacterium]